MKFGIKSAKLLKKRFDSEPVYNGKYLKSKIKSYVGKADTIFHNDKMPKEGSHCICILMVLIDSLFKIGKNYYTQVFLKKYKYIVKEKEVAKYINEDLEISHNDSDNEDSE